MRLIKKMIRITSHLVMNQATKVIQHHLQHQLQEVVGMIHYKIWSNT
jgi:hypothetical protein